MNLYQYLTRLLATVLIALLLGGCQATMQKIADCKAGDWIAIGHKDGYAGLMQNFNEHQVFCSAYKTGTEKTGADADYLSGWTEGNRTRWWEIGRGDGRNAQPVSGVEAHSAKNPKQQAPVNRLAYQAGWLVGNTEHWQEVGQRAGSAGMALAQKETSRTEAAALQIRFDEASYTSGWQIGNRIFWQTAGFQDAHNGIPDSQLLVRAASAKAANVLVQEEAYQTAWNTEIVNYWRNLGTLDAVSGRDFAMRSKEAQQKGLKVFEAEYRENWEERLASYWTQVGNEDGFGKPFQLEARMARAARDQVFVIARTRELYTQAWTVQNTRYCNVDDAFARGRRNERMAIEVCQIPLQGQLRRAYLSGQDYEVAAAKQGRAVAEINEYTRKVNDTRRKLEHVEHEIRSNIENKNRVVNAETIRDDKHHEQERHEFHEQLEHYQHDLEEARRWEEQYKQQMLKLKRDIYLN